jgi:hypothetical protein
MHLAIFNERRIAPPEWAICFKEGPLLFIKTASAAEGMMFSPFAAFF